LAESLWLREAKGDDGMVRELVALPRGVQAFLVVSLLLAVPGCSSASDAVTIYGDGDVSCPNHVADDDSLPVGTVRFEPGPGEVRVTVALTDAAPEWNYYVEVWTDEGCETETPLLGDEPADTRFTTDGDGAGELEFVLTGIEPGTYQLNVDVVARLGEPADPRHAEIAAAEFTEVIVDDDGGG
jgi:hypothetical protein